ncbi:MAG: helix-turn-helix transcriptional regulator [Fusobacteriaceae bacterium]
MKGLKEKRLEMKLTQIDLAQKVGVSMNTIILWEREVSEPNEENLKKLKEVLAIEE